MSNTKDYLDLEASEEQIDNVKALIKNVGFD